MADLSIDIETIGPDWAGLDLPTREYLTARWLRKPDLLDEDERELIEQGEWPDDDPQYEPATDKLGQRAGIELGLQEIVAVGMWLPDEERGMVIVRSSSHIENGTSSGGHPVATCVHEADLLTDTWRRIGRNRLVTFNGRGFDGPVIMVRSAQLGVPVTRNLVPYRYDLSEHCDLLDVLNFQGARWGGYGQDYWCRRFGVEGKGEFSGGDVARLWREGRYMDIAEYALDDARRQSALYVALRDSGFLATFKGGPRKVEQLEMAS